ncbi:MAG: flagellar hook-associated protein FlgK [Oligoflexia bacterium]|nr:flagellar hook-associated protein FlgK [Oligoflexia bacterium]
MGSDLLSIGRTGLSAAQKSLQTTAHNISNVNSDGYSRQKVVQQASAPVGEGNIVMGTGTYIRTIERIHDDFIEKRLNGAISDHNFNNERYFQLSIVENIFNEINYEGLNTSINNFFNSFRELSNNPGSETIRSLIRENAKILLQNFHRTNEALDKAAENINNNLDMATDNINSCLSAIASLNYKIREIEVTNGESGDLRDERDRYLNRLAEYFAVEYYSDEAGRFIVGARGVGTLVSGKLYQPLKSKSPPPTEDHPAFANAREILIDDKIISDRFQQGKVAALLETRNGEIKIMQEKIDEIAWSLATAVNALHRRGFINKEVELDENGQPIASSLEKATNIDFFKIRDNQYKAASLIDLSSDIKESLSNIATAMEPNAPGDNRIALAISKLQYEKIAANGESTLEEDYLQSASTVALTSGKYKIATEQSEGILAQTRSFREQISGVSVDEETANMMKYQRAYEASARVMKTADEMFKAVLSIKP